MFDLTYRWIRQKIFVRTFFRLHWSCIQPWKSLQDQRSSHFICRSCSIFNIDLFPLLFYQSITYCNHSSNHVICNWSNGWMARRLTFFIISLVCLSTLVSKFVACIFLFLHLVGEKCELDSIFLIPFPSRLLHKSIWQVTGYESFLSFWQILQRNKLY